MDAVAGGAGGAVLVGVGVRVSSAVAASGAAEDGSLVATVAEPPAPSVGTGARSEVLIDMEEHDRPRGDVFPVAFRVVVERSIASPAPVELFDGTAAIGLTGLMGIVVVLVKPISVPPRS